METIIELVKRKLRGIEMTEDDIRLAVEEAQQVILNFCNISEVPAALRFTWANMATDILKSLNAEDTGGAVSGGPASISMGDTNLSFSTSGSTTGHVVDLDNLINNYAAQLKKFRRIKWEPF
mgnify:FL=1